MTSTILFNLCGFIFIFASASFCKHSFKIFSKISSHPARSTCIRPCRHVGCRHPLTLDNRGHNHFTTPIKLTYHQLTVIVPLSQIQDSSKQANSMSYSAPIHIYLTTSINIRLTHGSRKTVANTRFHKRPGLSEKAVRICLLASLSNPTQSKNKISYIYTGITINCLLTEAITVRSMKKSQIMIFQNKDPKNCLSGSH